MPSQRQTINRNYGISPLSMANVKPSEWIDERFEVLKKEGGLNAKAAAIQAILDYLDRFQEKVKE